MFAITVVFHVGAIRNAVGRHHADRTRFAKFPIEDVEGHLNEGIAMPLDATHEHCNVVLRPKRKRFAHRHFLAITCKLKIRPKQSKGIIW